MAKKSSTAFRKNEYVRTLVDFPGIPAGTRGKVLMITGLEWERYHVNFDNGRALGQIGAEKLEAAPKASAADSAEVDAR